MALFDAFASVYTDAEQSKFIGGPLSIDDAWRRMALFVGHWALRGYGIWVLENKETGGFVGWSGLWFPKEFPGQEIGWTLLPAFRGKGFAREAGLRARAYAYDTLKWNTVISLIHVDNTPSKRVAEKQRLLDELRAQREADDKSRQESNAVRSADSQNKQYVVDERNTPRQAPSYSSSSSTDSYRRNYEDQWQVANEAQRRLLEENRQRYEEAANLQRAKAEVERQKRYLEQIERDDQYARSRREANSQPGR